jgi:predicted phosphodiesterase
MKLFILSDLHLVDSYDQPDVDCDAVVLAGDIGVRANGVRWARQTWPDHNIIYVAGNHEYYGWSIPHHTENLRNISHELRINFLECNEVIIGNVRFLGCTLWTDFEISGDRHSAMRAAAGTMNDYRYIRSSPTYQRLRPIDTLAIHAESTFWLEQKLKEAHDGPTVVVTHHVPTTKSILADPRCGVLYAAYISDLESLMPGVNMWVHGHTHYCVDYTIGSTRIVSNARGYSHEPCDGFDPKFVVEI